MTQPRFYLYTRNDGTITVHTAGCARLLLRRGSWTGPLTAEQVRVIPDYGVCQICLSDKFTLSPQAADRRALTIGKHSNPLSGHDIASQPPGRSRRPSNGDSA